MLWFTLTTWNLHLYASQDQVLGCDAHGTCQNDGNGYSFVAVIAVVFSCSANASGPSDSQTEKHCRAICVCVNNIKCLWAVLLMIKASKLTLTISRFCSLSRFGERFEAFASNENSSLCSRQFYAQGGSDIIAKQFGLLFNTLGVAAFRSTQSFASCLLPASR